MPRRPFGEITDINMPLDASSQKHKGFAFVQYDDKEDAAEAIDNMHNAELYGRVLRVNLAKPDSLKGGGHRPVWESQADSFFAADGGTAAAADGDERAYLPALLLSLKGEKIEILIRSKTKSIREP